MGEAEIDEVGASTADGNDLRNGDVVPASTQIRLELKATSSGGCLWSFQALECQQNAYSYGFESAIVRRNGTQVGQIFPPQARGQTIDTTGNTGLSGPLTVEVVPGLNRFVFELAMHATSGCGEAEHPDTAELVVYGGDRDDLANAGTADCNASVGEPVNVTNGNMYRVESDYDAPALRWFSVQRTFNSTRAKPSIPALFGTGWSSTLDERVHSYDSNLRRYDGADGRAFYFVGSGDDIRMYGGTSDEHLVMRELPDGGVLVRDVRGSTRTFDSAGRIVQVSDRARGSIGFVYDSAGLSRVTTSWGYTLNVNLGDGGRIQTLSDQTGTIATYTHGASGGALESVRFPDGSGFTYENFHCSPYWGFADSRWLFREVRDVLGNLVEGHTYDGSCRALASEKNGGVERYVLEYASETETRVTDALGNLSRFVFARHQPINPINRIGLNKVTRVEGACRCAQ